MEEEFVFLNIVYFLFAFFLIYPPNEVVSVGLSIPSLFSSVLGSEQMHFIYFHMIRILITASIHCLIPLGYFLFMALFSNDLNLFNLAQLSFNWRVYLGFSILFATFWLTLVYYWHINNFANHPIVQCLKLFAQSQNPARRSWKEIASEINIEFRRVDKFSAGNSFFNRIYVTDNWLIKVGLYTVNISSHQNIELVLTGATEINLTQDGSPNAQFLTILVKQLNPAFKSFSICLNSLEYKDFKEKLQGPIREACDVIIKQSLPEQFLDAFKEQIQNNQAFNAKREDVETCIGCMRKLADIKLVKECDSSDCRDCFCRPMWCLECLGKWFAYRQDQSQPNTWLSSKASCATCRATFCMLDVAPINLTD